MFKLLAEINWVKTQYEQFDLRAALHIWWLLYRAGPHLYTSSPDWVSGPLRNCVAHRNTWKHLHLDHSHQVTMCCFVYFYVSLLNLWDFLDPSFGSFLLQIFTKPITNFALQFPRTPDLHTGFNLFICNMAVSDVMMSLTAAPLTPVTSFTGRWFLGQGPCIILPACQVWLATLII